MTMLNILLIYVLVYMILGLMVLTWLAMNTHDEWVNITDVWTCMMFWFPVLIFAVFYRTYMWIKTKKVKK